MPTRRRFLTVFGGFVALGTQLGTISAADNSITPVDVFVVSGQSNACGRGTASRSPNPLSGTAYEFENDTATIFELHDPVGTGKYGAKTGSAWPAFAKTYHSNTGHKSAYIPTAVGAAAQVKDATLEKYPQRHWDADSQLRSHAVNAVTQAIDALRDEGYQPQLRGMLWSQGERDAKAIDKGNIRIEDYKQAFGEMLEYFRDQIRDYFPFWLFQTGMPNDGDTKGFEQVRNAQAEFPETEQDVQMISTIQKQFPSDGDMQNRLHYSQHGYNRMGRTGAKNLGPMPVTPGDPQPRDLNGDHRYEDVNGDGTTDVVDVQRLFAKRNSERVENAAGYDFESSGALDVVDVQRLFAEIT